MQQEQKTKPKKRVLSYIILAVCVLMLIAATVLTVYFVTNGTGQTIEIPPQGEQNEPNEPSGPSTPVDPTEPDEPSTGEDTVRFVTPVAGATYTVEYNIIYTNKTLGWIYRHKAVDFNAAAGTEVCCMADGKVESISYSRESGNLITIDHGDGLKTAYRFVEPDSALKEGAAIKKGDKIGTVAEAYGSERADGEHLHLEITLGGDAVDPTAYLDPTLEEK